MPLAGAGFIVTQNIRRCYTIAKPRVDRSIVFIEVQADKLRDIRRRLGIERPELARKSGVHEITIAKLETKQRSMRLSTAKKLADALGVDHAEFSGPERRNRR